MMRLSNPDSVVQVALHLVESNESSNIRLNANGGNSILIVCDPNKEYDYIKAIRTFMVSDKYDIIDLSVLLCEFVTLGKYILEESFELLKGSIHQIFRTPDGEEGIDFLAMILQAINLSYKAKRIPVLINTGSLYGSGIDNIHIMENELVMRAQLPLIILYPATREKDKLMFLSKRPASRYRCMIVE